jgi:hypothetical protein
MSFAMFFLAEYINMVTVSAIATICISAGGTGRFCRCGLAGSGFCEGRLPAVLLRLDAVDAAALSLRPADGVRVEVPAAVVGLNLLATLPGCCTLGFNLILFYVFAAIAVARRCSSWCSRTRSTAFSC